MIQLKVFLTFLTFNLLFGSCNSPEGGNKQAVASAGKEFQVALVTNGPLQDGGFNYTHYQAMNFVKKELAEKVKVVSLGEVAENADAERVMRKLIESGANLIIAASFGYHDVTLKLAKEFPKVNFLQVFGEQRTKNLGTYSAKMYQSWYVMGILAGSMTKTNKLGIVVAHPIPPLKWYINNYAMGAKSVNPKVQVNVTYINHWFDPNLAAEASEALISQKNDIITGILDNTTAIARKAEQRGVLFIGHNTDMRKFAPKEYIGGTEYNWSGLYLNNIISMMKGKWDGSTADISGGFAEGFVGVTPMAPTVPTDIKSKVSVVYDRIKNNDKFIFAGPIIDPKGKTIVKEGDTLNYTVATDWYVRGVNASQ